MHKTNNKWANMYMIDNENIKLFTFSSCSLKDKKTRGAGRKFGTYGICGQTGESLHPNDRGRQDDKRSGADHVD